MRESDWEDDYFSDLLKLRIMYLIKQIRVYIEYQ